MQQTRRLFCVSFRPPFKTISVGNISAGGVGKSVFARFLIDQMPTGGAIVLRGYGGRNERTGQSIILSDGKTIMGDVGLSGDEAQMFAQILSVPIVIGAHRGRSCELLTQYVTKNNKQLLYAVLDDAYQNHQVKKDIEILLLDARYPFENNHCLPAGKLREKDINRADVLILTHADRLPDHELVSLKRDLHNKTDRPIFAGKHTCCGMLDTTMQQADLSNLRNKKLLACAGIGSFSGFLSMLSTIGLIISSTRQFPDHHSYSMQDITDFIAQAKETGCDGIVTTRKDWQKLRLLIDRSSKGRYMTFFIADVSFSFLSSQEYADFFALLKRTISN